MREYNDCSTSGLLFSCNIYLTVKEQLNAARKNFKKSLVAFLIITIILATSVLGVFPGVDLMKSEIVSGVIGLAFIGLIIITPWNFRELRSKQSLESRKKEKLYSDYLIYMVDENSIWFDINGKIKSITIDQVTDDFVKFLLNSSQKSN